MPVSPAFRLLFILNKSSGKNDTDWQTLIRKFFDASPHTAEIFELPDSCCIADIEQQTQEIKPDRLVAVGGDGTIKLVAQCCMKLKLPLGILPAGSANGMAKELNIPSSPEQALQVLVAGTCCPIHLTKVNDEICIHLADMGFNAYVIRKFESYDSRGMWGYIKAAWAVLHSHARMQANIEIDGKPHQEEAAMIVIANATTYGTGAKINPKGKLNDALFEIVIVKKVSFTEIFKMIVTHQPYDPAKTVVYQTASLHIQSKRAAHFQVDGEYMGKVNEVKAEIIPHALEVIVPKQ